MAMYFPFETEVFGPQAGLPAFVLQNCRNDLRDLARLADGVCLFCVAE